MSAIGKACFALFLWIVPASAQGPTDNDLFAAYCIGVFQAWQAANAEAIKQKSSENACGPIEHSAVCRMEMSKIRENISRDNEAGRLRFVRYLAARGYLTNSYMQDSGQGLFLMIQSGRQQVAACSIDAEPCLNQCSNTEDLGKCIFACRDSTLSCARTDRCRRADALP